MLKRAAIDSTTVRSSTLVQLRSRTPGPLGCSSVGRSRGATTNICGESEAYLGGSGCSGTASRLRSLALVRHGHGCVKRCCTN